MMDPSITGGAPSLYTRTFIIETMNLNDAQNLAIG